MNLKVAAIKLIINLKKKWFRRQSIKMWNRLFLAAVWEELMMWCRIRGRVHHRKVIGNRSNRFLWETTRGVVQSALCSAPPGVSNKNTHHTMQLWLLELICMLLAFRLKPSETTLTASLKVSLSSRTARNTKKKEKESHFLWRKSLWRPSTAWIFCC